MSHVDVNVPSSTCFSRMCFGYIAVPMERRNGANGPGRNAFDGVVVQRGYRHRLLLPFAALLVREAEMERRTAAGRDVMVVDDAVEGEVHVMGGEGLPVVPRNVIAKMEGPRQTVLRALPRLGQRRLHFVGQPGRLGQALEQIPQDTRRRRVVRDGQIEGERLGDGGGRQGAALFSNGVLELLGVLSQLVDGGGLISGRRLCGGRRRRDDRRCGSRFGCWSRLCNSGWRRRRCGVVAACGQRRACQDHRCCHTESLLHVSSSRINRPASLKADAFPAHQ